MTDFVLTEFLYHAVSGCLILGVVVFFVWKAKNTHFPKEKPPIPRQIFDEELKPQQRRVMGFPGRLF